ncbi:outer membrane lipid asymmetry maintenance protein MlaD [Thiomicrorhabdus aquaedulcis]|uniref:outer membrane lipid asymmetry maintenance protein MlaD n=1 Tax=Thiomicrorhabdus aquaedulcis TaxID=2211106 RepID=UPI000FD9A4CC|nr:outer membrane lipid asymmetry maintenance protein MlaD [Thiomicrorhabdus aquaedulcis]
MKRQLKVEIWVGLLVLLALLALLMIAFQVSNFSALKERPSYQVSALFNNIGGLKVRAPVKISGVVVGRVTQIAVDSQSYKARVQMSIYTDYNALPVDSAASILTAGLLGEQYIGLEVGSEDDLLKEGATLQLTQSALVLEDLIGQFLVKFSDSKD